MVHQSQTALIPTLPHIHQMPHLQTHFPDSYIPQISVRKLMQNKKWNLISLFMNKCTNPNSWSWTCISQLVQEEEEERIIIILLLCDVRYMYKNKHTLMRVLVIFFWLVLFYVDDTWYVRKNILIKNQRSKNLILWSSLWGTNPRPCGFDYSCWYHQNTVVWILRASFSTWEEKHKWTETNIVCVRKPQP